MAIVKPFMCIRPSLDKVEKIAALPYDVYDRAEAKKIVESNKESFLAIDRPETNFSEKQDMYALEVYEYALKLIEKWKSEGRFISEEEKCFYLYELTMNNRIQTGIVACIAIDDYVNGKIKKHENTRAEKEKDRICHIDICSAQTGPIFLVYRRNEEISEIINRVKGRTALYDFVAEDGVRHRIFKIEKLEEQWKIENSFKNIDQLYIADGHHRAAAAVEVGLKRRIRQQKYSGEEPYNYFLSVLFAEEELLIMDYNRVVRDLNGLSVDDFLEQVKKIFNVTEVEGQIKPCHKGQFTMFLDEKWYVCDIKKEDVPKGLVERLDVSILQDMVLCPILGIENPRKDSRIDFVGGIRGLDELERRVRTDAKVAFAMYPTSMSEMLDIADNNLLMPPKSTWFEPKLRSGIFIHEI